MANPQLEFLQKLGVLNKNFNPTHNNAEITQGGENQPKSAAAENDSLKGAETAQTPQGVETFIDDLKAQKMKEQRKKYNKKYYEAHKPKSNIVKFGDSGFICGSKRKVDIVNFIIKNSKDGKFTMKQKEIREALGTFRQTTTDTYKLLKEIGFWHKENGVWIIDKPLK